MWGTSNFSDAGALGKGWESPYWSMKTMITHPKLITEVNVM